MAQNLLNPPPNLSHQEMRSSLSNEQSRSQPPLYRSATSPQQVHETNPEQPHPKPSLLAQGPPKKKLYGAKTVPQNYVIELVPPQNTPMLKESNQMANKNGVNLLKSNGIEQNKKKFDKNQSNVDFILDQEQKTVKQQPKFILEGAITGQELNLKKQKQGIFVLKSNENLKEDDQSSEKIVVGQKEKEKIFSKKSIEGKEKSDLNQVPQEKNIQKIDSNLQFEEKQRKSQEKPLENKISQKKIVQKSQQLRENDIKQNKTQGQLQGNKKKVIGSLNAVAPHFCVLEGDQQGKGKSSENQQTQEKQDNEKTKQNQEIQNKQNKQLQENKPQINQQKQEKEEKVSKKSFDQRQKEQESNKEKRKGSDNENQKQKAINGRQKIQLIGKQEKVPATFDLIEKQGQTSRSKKEEKQIQKQEKQENKEESLKADRVQNKQQQKQQTQIFIRAVPNSQENTKQEHSTQEKNQNTEQNNQNFLLQPEQNQNTLSSGITVNSIIEQSVGKQTKNGWKSKVKIIGSQQKIIPKFDEIPESQSKYENFLPISKNQQENEVVSQQIKEDKVEVLNQKKQKPQQHSSKGSQKHMNIVRSSKKLSAKIDVILPPKNDLKSPNEISSKKQKSVQKESQKQEKGQSREHSQLSQNIRKNSSQKAPWRKMYGAQTHVDAYIFDLSEQNQNAQPQQKSQEQDTNILGEQKKSQNKMTVLRKQSRKITAKIDNIQESQEKSQEKVQQKAQENIQQKPQENVSQKVQQKSQEKVQGQIQEKSQEKQDEKQQEKPQEKAQEKVEEKPQENIDRQSQKAQKLQNAVENNKNQNKSNENLQENVNINANDDKKNEEESQAKQKQNIQQKIENQNQQEEKLEQKLQEKLSEQKDKQNQQIETQNQNEQNNDKKLQENKQKQIVNRQQIKEGSNKIQEIHHQQKQNHIKQNDKQNQNENEQNFILGEQNDENKEKIKQNEENENNKKVEKENKGESECKQPEFFLLQSDNKKQEIQGQADVKRTEGQAAQQVGSSTSMKFVGSKKNIGAYVQQIFPEEEVLDKDQQKYEKLSSQKSLEKNILKNDEEPRHIQQSQKRLEQASHNINGSLPASDQKDQNVQSVLNEKDSSHKIERLPQQSENVDANKEEITNSIEKHIDNTPKERQSQGEQGRFVVDKIDDIKKVQSNEKDPSKTQKQQMPSNFQPTSKDPNQNIEVHPQCPESRDTEERAVCSETPKIQKIIQKKQIAKESAFVVTIPEPPQKQQNVTNNEVNDEQRQLGKQKVLLQESQTFGKNSEKINEKPLNELQKNKDSNDDAKNIKSQVEFELQNLQRKQSLLTDDLPENLGNYQFILEDKQSEKQKHSLKVIQKKSSKKLIVEDNKLQEQQQFKTVPQAPIISRKKISSSQEIRKSQQKIKSDKKISKEQSPKKEAKQSQFSSPKNNKNINRNIPKLLHAKLPQKGNNIAEFLLDGEESISINILKDPTLAQKDPRASPKDILGSQGSSQRQKKSSKQAQSSKQLPKSSLFIDIQSPSQKKSSSSRKLLKLENSPKENKNNFLNVDIKRSSLSEAKGSTKSISKKQSNQSGTLEKINFSHGSQGDQKKNLVKNWNHLSNQKNYNKQQNQNDKYLSSNTKYPQISKSKSENGKKTENQNRNADGAGKSLKQSAQPQGQIKKIGYSKFKQSNGKKQIYKSTGNTNSGVDKYLGVQKGSGMEKSSGLSQQFSDQNFTSSQEPQSPTSQNKFLLKKSEFVSPYLEPVFKKLRPHFKGSSNTKSNWERLGVSPQEQKSLKKQSMAQRKNQNPKGQAFNSRQIQKLKSQYEKLREMEEEYAKKKRGRSQGRRRYRKLARSPNKSHMQEDRSSSEDSQLGHKGERSHKFLKAHSHQFSYLYPSAQLNQNANKLNKKLQQLDRKLRKDYSLEKSRDKKKKQQNDVQEYIAYAKRQMHRSQKIIENLDS